MKPSYTLAVFAFGFSTASCFNPSIESGSFTCTSQCPEGQRCVEGVCISGAIEPDVRHADATPPPDGSLEKGRVYMDGSIPKDAAGCADEANEPNNSSATATALGSTTTISGLAICYPGDVDHFSIRVQQATRLRVSVQFAHADGDLDAVLLDPDGQTIDESKGVDDGEVVEMASGAPATDRYIIGVAGYDGAVNSYSLLIEVL